MESILRHAVIRRPCNECGGSYFVSLHDVLLEHRVLDEWQSSRPSCGACRREFDQLVHQVPRETLESLAAAWDTLLNCLRQHSVEVEFR